MIIIMGQFISTTHLLTKFEIDGKTIDIEIKGDNIQSSLKNRPIEIVLHGYINGMKNGFHKITSTEIQERFHRFVVDNFYRDFCTNVMFQKSNNPDEIAFTYPVNFDDYKALAWTFPENGSFLREDYEGNNFALCIKNEMQVVNRQLNGEKDVTFRDAVAALGKSFVECIASRKIPVFDINDDKYSFVITKAEFTIV